MLGSAASFGFFMCMLVIFYVVITKYYILAIGSVVRSEPRLPSPNLKLPVFVKQREE